MHSLLAAINHRGGGNAARERLPCSFCARGREIGHVGISQRSQACSPSMATLVQHELPLLPTATPETRAWRNRDGICSLVICLPFPPAPVLHVCPGTGGWDGAIKLILADRFITERSALPALCQSPPQRGMSWASPRTPGTGCTADLQLVHQQSPHLLGPFKNTRGMESLVQPESWQSTALL